MLLFSLFASTLAYFETLTSKNYTLLINESQKYPVFALLQSRWCSHCMELKPTWKRVQEYFQNDTRFYFADISCDTDNDLCNKFSSSGTPRIFWVKFGIETAEQFINSYTYEEFITFVEKRLSPIITDIYNHTNFIEFLRQNQELSIFAYQEFQISDSSDKPPSQTQKIFTKIAADYDSFPCRFINMKYQEFESKESEELSQPILKYICSWTNSTDRLRRSFDEKSMRTFVNLYSYPPIYSATNFFLKNRVKARMHFMLYYDNDKVTFYGKLVKLTSKFPPWFKTGVIDCIEVPRVCRVFGMRLIGGHELVIVLPHKNIYYRFNGEFKNTTVYNWVERVLAGKEEALGPGAGFKGFFFNLKLQMKEPGFWKNTIIKLTIGIVTLVFIVKGIMKCIELGTPPFEEEDEKNEKMKENCKQETDEQDEKSKKKEKTD